jgi:hypothetical protein
MTFLQELILTCLQNYAGFTPKKLLLLKTVRLMSMALLLLYIIMEAGSIKVRQLWQFVKVLEQREEEI